MSPGAPGVLLKGSGGELPAAARLARGTLRSRAITGSGWTLLGLAGQRVLRLGGNLILTRMLFPEAFGLMTLVQVVVRGLKMFSDIGLSGSIVRHPRGDEPAFLGTAYSLGAIRGAAIWLVAAALAAPAAWFYGEGALLYLIPIVAVSSLLDGLNATRLATLNRHLVLGRLTVVEFGSQAIALAAMVLLAWLFESVWALVAGALVASAAKLVMSFTIVPGAWEGFRWEPAAAREMIRYGRWILFSTAVAFLVSESDRIVLGKLFETTAQLGVYSIAFLLAHAVPEAVAALGPRVMMPVYARLAEGDAWRLRRKTWEMRATLLAVTVPPLVALSIWGEQVVEFLWDSRYHEAGWMLRILAAGNVALVVALSAERIALAVGDSRRFTAIQLGRLIPLALGMAAGFWAAGLAGLLAGMAASYWVSYPVVAWGVRRYGVWTPGLDLGVLAASAAAIAAGYWLV